jgi:hypothetical protein
LNFILFYSYNNSTPFSPFCNLFEEGDFVTVTAGEELSTTVGRSCAEYFDGCLEKNSIEFRATHKSYLPVAHM